MIPRKKSSQGENIWESKGGINLGYYDNEAICYQNNHIDYKKRPQKKSLEVRNIRKAKVDEIHQCTVISLWMFLSRGFHL